MIIIPCSICRSILAIPTPWVAELNTTTWGYVQAKPILFNTVGIYFFCRLCNWVLVRWLTPRWNVIIGTKIAFQWINVHFSDTLLHASAQVRRVTFANWTSNWLSCFHKFLGLLLNFCTVCKLTMLSLFVCSCLFYQHYKCIRTYCVTQWLVLPLVKMW